MVDEVGGEGHDLGREKGRGMRSIPKLRGGVLSRNRSVCGVRPYVRATTNPDPDSWVASFLAPWLEDGKAGRRLHPLHARSGEIRHFIRVDGKVKWFEQPVFDDKGEEVSKSVTFIRATIFDNPILLKANPEYLANLKALPVVDRRRLLDGDWTAIKEGDFFKAPWFRIVREAPAGLSWVRPWDLADTKPDDENDDPDWTASPCVAEQGGTWYIREPVRIRDTPGEVDKCIVQTAKLDALFAHRTGGSVEIWFREDPGSAGARTVSYFQQDVLVGYPVRSMGKVSGNKLNLAKPVSAAAEAGNVCLVVPENDPAEWVEPFLREFAQFPGGKHDDWVDGLSMAFEILRPQVRDFGEMQRVYAQRVEQRLAPTGPVAGSSKGSATTDTHTGYILPRVPKSQRNRWREMGG